MQKILRAPELVDEILSVLSLGDLYSTIRVDNYFFAASKKFLWRSIALEHALKLLGPIKYSFYSDHYRILEPPTDEAWERFFEYATHVKNLSCSGFDGLALHDIFQSTPETSRFNNIEYLFPRCRHLKWHGTDELKNIGIEKLVSPSLESFILEQWDSDPESQWFDRLSSTFANRSSNLQVLRLNIGQFLAEANPPNLEPYFRLLKSCSGTLTNVALPGALATAATFMKLTGMQNLSSLEFYYDNIPSSSDEDHFNDDGNFAKMFPSLQHITFNALVSPTKASTFFRTFAVKSLRTIYWKVLEPPPNIGNFFATIADKCPELELLMLGDTDVDSAPILSWSSVLPILRCSKLSHLDLHCCRVDMTFDNYVELVRSRKESVVWQVLQVFTAEAFHFPRMLRVFAKYSPDIQALGLNAYVNEDIDPFAFISPMRLPRYSLPLVANFWSYLDAQLKKAERTQNSQTLLPRLALIDFHFSRFASDDCVLPLAALLLAACKNPVYVKGWAPSLSFIYQIYEHTAIYLMGLEKRIDKPMSPAAEKYVGYYVQNFETWDFNPAASSCLFHNLHDYVDIKFPA